MTIAVILAALLVAGTCTFHHEAMRAVAKVVSRVGIGPRYRVLGTVILLFGVHMAEVGFYGAAFWLAIKELGLGALGGMSVESFLDYFYFSAVTYTSLGLGDVFPSGHLRFLTGVEALNGLLLIAWSGAYTYLAMGKFWAWDPCHGGRPRAGAPFVIGT